MSNYETVLTEARKLELLDQFRLWESLAAHLRRTSCPPRSILELKGLGKEIWEGIDAQE